MDPLARQENLLSSLRLSHTVFHSSPAMAFQLLRIRHPVFDGNPHGSINLQPCHFYGRFFPAAWHNWAFKYPARTNSIIRHGLDILERSPFREPCLLPAHSFTSWFSQSGVEGENLLNATSRSKIVWIWVMFPNISACQCSLKYFFEHSPTPASL